MFSKRKQMFAHAIAQKMAGVSQISGFRPARTLQAGQPSVGAAFRPRNRGPKPAPTGISDLWPQAADCKPKAGQGMPPVGNILYMPKIGGKHET